MSYSNSMGLCEARCTFLASTSRRQLPHILQRLGYRGASAEVGVWKGSFSSALLGQWRIGGQHYLVDPYLQYDKGCPHGGTNLSAGKRKHLSGGQWHCRFLQRDFDVVYNRTRSRILAEVCSHTQS